MSELVDRATLELARSLYFQFFSIDKIAEETGLSKRELRLHIYGDRGHLSPSVGSWYYERSMDNTQEFVELAQRNKLLAHKFTALAIQEAYESLKILSKKLDKKGNKVAFSPFDMEKLFGIISQLDKMQRLSAGLPTDIFHLDMPKGTGELGDDDSDVLDMKVLAETIASDKGLMKLIQGATDEKGSDQRESGDSGGGREVRYGIAEPGSGGDGRPDEQGGVAESPDPGAQAGTSSSEETGKGTTAGALHSTSAGPTTRERLSGGAESSYSDEQYPDDQAGAGDERELQRPASSESKDGGIGSSSKARVSGDGKGRSKNRDRKTSERRRSKEITEAELSGDWSDDFGLADEYEPI